MRTAESLPYKAEVEFYCTSKGDYSSHGCSACVK